MMGEGSRGENFLMEIDDEDILEAMKQIPGYLDITPGDFKQVYLKAYEHALNRLTTSLKAADVMTTDVVWVKEDRPVVEVAEIMEASRVSGLPVIGEDGKVVGVISEKDYLVEMGADQDGNFMTLIVECLKTGRCKSTSVRVKKAADIMSQPAVTVGEETALQEVTAIFAQEGINRVPVLDRRSKLTGIVTREDILRIPWLRLSP
jgi:CBS-domain-containing membrane protein